MIRSVAVMMVMGGAAMAQTPEVIEAIYTCERGVQVPVSYINADGFDGVAVIVVEGRQVALRQFIAASGAKYASFDEQLGYRWWSKGDTGVLSFQAADDMAEEITLLSECISQTR